MQNISAPNEPALILGAKDSIERFDGYDIDWYSRNTYALKGDDNSLDSPNSIPIDTEIEYDKKECCSICFEEFGNEDIQQCELTCKNVFHTECINLWLASNNSCPLCRSNWITSTSDNPLEEFKGLSI